VLKELPPKRRQVIELPQDGCEQVILEELKAFELYQVELDKLKEACAKAKVSDDLEAYKTTVRLLRSGTTYAFSQIAKMRLRTALAKMPMVLSHLDNLVDGEGQKIVVFGHHHEVLRAVKSHFGNRAVLVSGEVQPKLRHESVTQFQTDDKVRVFVGSTTVAGVGLTLTEASLIVFVELDWVPAVLSQAEDRCHRIGQLYSVLVQHLVLSGSLDATMSKRLIKKQERNDAVTNKDEGECVYG
jgi:SWI/SNF-related matrix-associated actin-dependent regulator 1 of chromatin subfamily A